MDDADRAARREENRRQERERIDRFCKADAFPGNGECGVDRLTYLTGKALQGILANPTVNIHTLLQDEEEAMSADGVQSSGNLQNLCGLAWAAAREVCADIANNE